MRYSDNFERDFAFYMRNLDKFQFCGKVSFLDKRGTPLVVQDSQGRPAKECFYIFDSTGKVVPCREPDMLLQLHRTKAAVNWQIKQWAEGTAAFERMEPMLGFTQLFLEIYKEFELPIWVKVAVMSQVRKLIGAPQFVSTLNRIKTGGNLNARMATL